MRNNSNPEKGRDTRLHIVFQTFQPISEANPQSIEKNLFNCSAKKNKP